MAYDGSIRINTKINTDGLNRGLDNIDSRITRLTHSVGAFVKKVAVIAGITGLTVFSKQCIDAASDLQEVQNVVDTAFEDMAYKAEQFADTALESFGLSEYSAKKMSSTYMAMGKSMGLSMEQASDMAISISKRTADIASFYNLTAEEAAVKMKSIYTGETETLKELGIVMTEANLKQFALEQGISKSYSAMTQAEKVALRYAYVMNASNDAAGDFVRTQNSWANQTRVLSELFTKFKAIMGEFLITALNPALTLLNTMLKTVISIAEASKSLLSEVFGIEFQNMTSGAAVSVEGMASGMDDVADATENAEKAQKKYNKTLSLAKFDSLNKLMSSDSSGNSNSSSAGDVDKILSGVKDKNTESPIDKASDSVDKMKEKLKNLLKAISPVTDSLKKLNEEGLAKLSKFSFGTLKDFYNHFLKPLGKYAISEKGLPRLFNVTNNLLKKINWNLLKKSMKKVYESMEDMAELSWDALMDFYEYFMVPVGKWTFNEAIPKLADSLSGISDKFGTLRSVNNIKKLWNVLSKFTAKIGSGLIDFCDGMANIALDYLIDLDWVSFYNALDHLLNVIANVALNIGEGIIKFFKGIQPVASWLTNAFIKLLEGLFAALDWFTSFPTSAKTIKTLGSAIAGAITAIATVRMVNKVISFIRDLGGAAKYFYGIIAANPVIAFAAAAGAIAGAIVSLCEATNTPNEVETWFDDFSEGLDKVKDKTNEVADNINNIRESLDDSENKAEGDYKYVKDLADQYYELAGKTKQSREETKKMKRLAKQMQDVLGSDGEYGIAINETTGLISNQKDEIYKNIEAMKKQALEAAKVDALKSYYTELVNAEKNVADAVGKNKEAYKKYLDAKKKLDDYTKTHVINSDNPKEVKEYLNLYDAMEKAKTAMENAGQATYDARTEVNNIKTSIDTLESTLDTFDASDFSKSLKQEAADSKNIFKKAGEDSAKEFNNGISAIVDKAEGIGKKAADNLKKGMTLSAINIDIDPRFKAPVKKKLGGIFTGGSWRNIPQFAAGMPSGVRGTLFWAGEAGPEIVAQGRGGSSEILNASQIASAIYSAVVSANKECGGNVQVNIVPDTKNIFRAVVKENKANARITGVNQLGGLT